MICHADERNAMILVTGGSGFIGSHTVRALHGLGEPSVVMQRRSGQVPPHLADLPVVAEQADVADLDSLRAIGGRPRVTDTKRAAGHPSPRRNGACAASASPARSGSTPASSTAAR